jgi:hypothetical protein
MNDWINLAVWWIHRFLGRAEYWTVDLVWSWIRVGARQWKDQVRTLWSGLRMAWTLAMQLIRRMAEQTLHNSLTSYA